MKLLFDIFLISNIISELDNEGNLDLKQSEKGKSRNG